MDTFINPALFALNQTVLSFNKFSPSLVRCRLFIVGVIRNSITCNPFLLKLQDLQFDINPVVRKGTFFVVTKNLKKKLEVSADFYTCYCVR